MTNTRSTTPIVICPGIHPYRWTQDFLQSLGGSLDQRQVHIFPAHQYPAFSGLHVFQFMQRCLKPAPLCPKERPKLILIGFSAGVVGAVQAAGMWQGMGGELHALMALDGWGVPIPSHWPLYRLSHDHFTDWSSAILGGGCDRFFADPPVEHGQLWKAPHQTRGWWLHQPPVGAVHQRPMTAAAFIKRFALGVPSAAQRIDCDSYDATSPI